MPRPCKLTFDLLTMKMVSESRMTWATSVPILVLLGLSVLDLGPIYATDRRHQTSDRKTSDTHHRLMPPTLGAGGIIILDALYGRNLEAQTRRVQTSAKAGHLVHIKVQ